MEEENVALARKGKAKKGSNKGSNSQSEKKKKEDLSKVESVLDVTSMVIMLVIS